ncbi:hypothetical protein Avbf_05993 [Armadillidium vulgare]|nr:hypothetical protein Avbf_05993 [Armadillidium vulgare]
MKTTKIIKIQNLTTNWTNLKSVSNEEETKIYTDGRKEIDEGNDVYDIIEALPKEELSHGFKSFKMFNLLLKNPIDYMKHLKIDQRNHLFLTPNATLNEDLSRSETSNFNELMNLLIEEICEVRKNECFPTTESSFPSGSQLFIDTIS